jgi:ferredoxin
MKKLRIDSSLCEGHGMCFELAPNLIEEDERAHGIVKVEDVEASQEAAAVAAMNACPERAISLTDD